MSLWRGHRTASLLSPIPSVTLGREWHHVSHPDLKMPPFRYYAEVAGLACFQSFFDLGQFEQFLLVGLLADFSVKESFAVARKYTLQIISAFLLLPLLVVVFWKNCFSLPCEFLIEVGTALE